MDITATGPDIAAIDAAYDMAKTIQNLDFMKAMQIMHDAALRDLAVMELQNQLLAAKTAHIALADTVNALRKELADQRRATAGSAARRPSSGEPNGVIG